MTGPKDTFHRLFVAIELSGEVRQTLARLIDDLRRQDLEELRWVRPEGIHLTLKFLGETPLERLGPIKKALAGAVEGVSTHRLSLGRLGTFGSSRAPSVLWVDVEGDIEALRGLQARVEKALAPLGFSGETRGFSPHLTLARIRPEIARSVAPKLEKAFGRLPPPAQEIDVRELALMKSELRRSGAVYDQLAAFPLA